VDVFDDLAKESWGDIAAFVKGHRCTSAIRVPKLFVGSGLPDFDKAEAFERTHYFLGF
jgi:hypothetical protein